MKTPTIISTYDCSVGDGHTLRHQIDYFLPHGPFAMLLLAFKMLGITECRAPGQFGRNSTETGDTLLAHVQEGLTDITTPDYYGMPERLINASIVPIPVYYRQTSFLLSLQLLAHTHRVCWHRVFSRGVWIAFGVWRAMQFLMPLLSMIPNKLRLNTASATLGFFLTTYFRKKYLSSRIKHANRPFRTLDKARHFAQKHGLIVAFIDAISSTVDSWEVKKVAVRGGFHLLRFASNDSRVMVIGDYDRLGVILAQHPIYRHVVRVVKGTEVDPLFAICRRGLPMRHALAVAFATLNDHGLTYGLRPMVSNDKAVLMKPLAISIASVPVRTCAVALSVALIVLLLEFVVGQGLLKSTPGRS